MKVMKEMSECLEGQEEDDFWTVIETVYFEGNNFIF